MKHIALPLRVEQHHIQDGHGGIVISKIYQNSNTGATLPLCEIPWNEEFAEFIVQACNSHEELVEALRIAIAALQNNDIDESMAGEFEILTDTLANATK